MKNYLHGIKNNSKNDHTDIPYIPCKKEIILKSSLYKIIYDFHENKFNDKEKLTPWSELIFEATVTSVQPLRSESLKLFEIRALKFQQTLA